MCNLIKNLVVFFYILIYCTSCSLTEQEGKVKRLWKTDITDKHTFAGSTQMPIYEGNVITPATVGDNFVLQSINVETGKMVWQSEAMPGEKASSNAILYTKPYVYQNIAVYVFIDNRFAINLDTGQFLWKKKSGYFNEYVEGIGNNYYACGSNDQNSAIVYKGNITNGNEEILRQHPLGNTEDNYSCLAFIDQTGKAKMVYALNQYDRANAKSKAFMGLMDLESKTVVYEKQVEADPLYWVGLFKVHGNQLHFTTLQTHHAFNLSDGTKLWEKAYSANSTFGGVIDATNNLWINQCEFQHLCALNLSDGSIKWKTRTGGNMDYPYQHNGVLYFTDAGDGRFYAMDSATGAIIWAIDTPEGRVNFSGPVSGIGDKVFVRSYTSLYAYRTAR